MFLLVAPTRNELNALKAGLSAGDTITTLVSGVGILESSLTLLKFLAETDIEIHGVFLAGIGGAFSKGGAKILDICLADKEILADLGVCYTDRIEPLDDSFAPVTKFDSNTNLCARAENILKESAIHFHKGPFVTVSSVSGTKSRGDFLQSAHRALCENMEGAAIARICNVFNIPWLEIRCISNMVVDREDQTWDVDGALSHCSKVIRILMEGFLVDS